MRTEGEAILEPEKLAEAREHRRAVVDLLKPLKKTTDEILEKLGVS